MYDHDRRRLLLAAIMTMIAVPAFFILRGDDSSSAPAATSGDVINPVDDNVINPLPDQAAPAATEQPATSNESKLPPLEPPDDDPIFMNGPVANAEDEIAEVAIPAQPAIPPIVVEASYLSTVPGTRSCLIRGVESGRTVRVTNLDNGRSITCVTVIAPATQRNDLVMHTESFEQLADLTDAPIAVEVGQ